MSVTKFLKKAKEIQEQPRKVEIVKSHENMHDESNWLVSYADMMTLLCGFFIMLFSMAKLDDPKYDSFKEAVAKHFGGEYTSPTKELAKFATEILQEMGMSKEATIKSDPLGVSIVFESTVFFDTLSANVKPEGKRVLETIVDKIGQREKQNGKKYRIVVEGHTDSRPIIGGLYPSNWELSGARAARVVRMFLDHGFPADRLTAIGYGDTRPKLRARRADGTLDEDALAKNRRVVLRFLEPNVDAIPFPDGQSSATASSSDSAPESRSPASSAH